MRRGFRLGIYVFKDAEIVDFAAPYGVFSVARRFEPELEAFLVAEAMRPVQAAAAMTLIPTNAFAERPAMDAFLIPGGFGTRQEMHNRRLHDYIHSLPENCLLTNVCTDSWVYAQMWLLDGLAATNRKEPDRAEAAGAGKVPIDRLAEIAPPAGSAVLASSIRAASSPRAESHRAWSWDSTYCGAPASRRSSSPKSRG